MNVIEENDLDIAYDIIPVDYMYIHQSIVTDCSRGRRKQYKSHATRVYPDAI